VTCEASAALSTSNFLTIRNSKIRATKPTPPFLFLRDFRPRSNFEGNISRGTEQQEVIYVPASFCRRVLDFVTKSPKQCFTSSRTDARMLYAPFQKCCSHSLLLCFAATWRWRSVPPTKSSPRWRRSWGPTPSLQKMRWSTSGGR
jgi:hypothetical protein